MDIKINRALYRDKVHACWIGKNIGGTMGTPFEGRPDLLDVKGYTSPKGEPLPNDDLDLQLVWLRAIRDVGPKALNANVLSWYWCRYISAIWNEYGIGRTNASLGITPPMSGELGNEGWHASNGAWIRSEIWACLAPGHPNIATRYATMEASIDHGVSEGTAAEIFTAALESMAFCETDVHVLIEGALGYLPPECRVARSVRLVMDEYAKGTDWREVRRLVLEENADLGFFQAPGNLAFVTIGLLYGEGDFLRSLLLAINCGDDTDCTGATVGAVLGIMGGTAAIPGELAEYIGDRIITMSLDTSSFPGLPKTCHDLTEQVIRTMPTVMSENGYYTEYSEEGPCVNYPAPACNGESLRFLSAPPLTVEYSNHWLAAAVNFESEPRLREGESLSFRVTLRNKSYTIYHLSLRVMPPNGWKAEYPKGLPLQHRTAARDMQYVSRPRTKNTVDFTVTLTANEAVAAINRVYLAVEALGYPEPLMIPLTVLG